jgi:DNA-binding MarR family transcriptional regulator
MEPPSPSAGQEDDIGEEITRAVGTAWRELRRGAAMRALRGHLFGFGEEALHPAQLDCLEVLVQRGPCRMGELAEALRVDASTATRTLQPLVSDGLVERAPTIEDARAKVVRPTAAGRARYERLAAQRRSVLTDILRRIPPADREQLAVLMGEFVAALDSFVADCAGPDAGCRP